jgi:signal transduction histidine kinase
MDLSVPQAALSELAAAYFQALVTLGLGLMCLGLHRRYRKPYFQAWAFAWGVYALRMGAIISFMHSGATAWLFWHQVLTGWTALALLWAAFVFWRRSQWRARLGLWALFPLAWSYVAIYELETFFLAAAPAVLFLSLATLGTAWAFRRYHLETGSAAARWIAAAMALWALHHLDYPFLRARGVWNPWGYYLDVGFELALGIGILFLVLEDLDEGLRALSSLSAELQPKERVDDLPDALMDRALTLRSVRGSALFLDALAPGAGIPAVAASGVCAAWTQTSPPPRVRAVLAQVVGTGEPQVASPALGGLAQPGEPRYLAALPVIQSGEVAGSLVVVGEARDPFAALDTRFLVALGQQVGAALENAALTRRLETRTMELERLQTRMVHRHEEERQRISRELHDETAQILAAVSLRLGVLAEQGNEEMSAALDQVRTLVGETIRSIRGVTRNLRPVALDDLGLLAALRALARDLEGHDGAMEIHVDSPPRIPEPGPESELALYRAVQEALANAVRHGQARTAWITLRHDASGIDLEVRDDGSGVAEGFRIEGNSRHSGLAGIRERVTALGGRVSIRPAEGGGTQLHVQVPWSQENER